MADQENGQGAVSRPRLQERYWSEIAPRLAEEFGYGNPMRIPRLVKVVANTGTGDILGSGRDLEVVVAQMASICGQKPVVTRAKKSVANFKLREGNQVGVTCTMRGARMWEFLDRTINAALPRIRDFQGVSRTAFDGRGNYSLGIREHIVYPEIDFGGADSNVRGMQISIVTTAPTDAEGRRLLELLGFPFERSG